jgi:hypothetical protein
MYFYDLKSGLTKKFGNLFPVYVMNTINCNKIDCKFSFASKMFGHIHHKIWGHFSH